MQKQIILGILQKVRADHEFAVVWNEDNPQNILKVLEEEGLKMNGQDILGATVNSQDILDTKDVQWIIQALGQPTTNGASSNHHLPSLLEVSASVPPIAAAERRAESRMEMELQQGLVGIIKQIAQSYWYVTWMSNITFILGVVLILLSAISSLVLQEDTASYLMGAMGLAGVIGPLVFRPSLDLQNSRANLAQLQAVFINWINGVHNWNRYWELVMNQNRSSNQPPPPLEEVSRISNTLVNSARQMMELIEQYCELPQNRRKSNKSGKANQGISQRLGNLYFSDEERQTKDERR
jgi:hypothetical protein